MGEERKLCTAKTDSAIEYIRVIAMLMIVMCHIFQYYNNELAWWFNVGVQIFFITSGFLYGTKDIDDPIAFLGKQLKKILIPYYVFLVPVSLLYFLFAPEHISIIQFVKALFCADLIDGIKHLWFVPYILFCYFITPYLCWIRKKLETLSLLKMTILCFLFMCLYMVLGLLFDSFFAPNRVVCYILGYFLRMYFAKYGKKVLLFSGICFIPLGLVVNAIRIYIRYVAKPVSGILLSLFSYYEQAGHVLLGLALFLLMYLVFSKVTVIRAVQTVSRYSYFVYIVHLLFLLSPFSLLRFFEGSPVGIVLAVAAIGLSAFVLKIVSDKVNRLCK